jgi:hypothetical protein
MGSIMGWYKFDSREEFNAWHQEVKTKLGLPKLSIDSNGNQVEPLIENYTQLILNEDRLIAYSEPEYAVGLLETEKPVFKMKLVKR